MTSTDLLMLSAVDRIHGSRHAHVPSVIAEGDCIRRLLDLGPGERAQGGTIEPGLVLERLDGYRPHDRQSRGDYSAMLKLALVAEAFGVVLACGEGDPMSWAPHDHPDFWNDETQQALGFITAQLGCSVDQAAHRLFAHLGETDTSLLGTAQDIIARRLTFLGTHDATTVVHDRPDAS